MKEEREVSEYEIDYDYDDEHLDISEEEIREKRLPEVVLNFEKVATEYSRGNNVPAIVSFYTLQLFHLLKLVKILEYIAYGFKLLGLVKAH